MPGPLGGCIPVLTYHRIANGWNPSLSPYVVRPSRFARQMRFLTRRGYRTLSLDEFYRTLSSDGALDRSRSVVITFDDGFEDFAEYAWPILSGLDLKATLFMVAGLAGQAARWLASEDPTPPRLLSWETLRTLSADGLDIQSHSLTHPDLTAIAERDVRHELEISRAVLEQRLGRPVRYFAYPKGRYNQAVEGLLPESGYLVGFTTDRGVCRVPAHFSSLPRVGIEGSDSLLTFLFKLTTGWPIQRWVRRRVKREIQRLLPAGAQSP